MTTLDPSAGASAATPSILVADDEVLVLEILSRHLERRGYRVIPAHNGREALSLFRRHTIDMVLTDLRMPEMDGLALLKAIKEVNPRVPVVLMSGYGEVETVVASLKAGAENFLSKPLNMDEITRIVEQALSLSCLQPRGGLGLGMLRQVTYLESPSSREMVCELVYQIANSAVAVGYADGDLDNNIKLALVEAVTNAMEHGNRWDPNKKVFMEAVVSPEELHVTIEDQGAGFHPRVLDDPTDPDNLLQERGRGVFLMHSIMDQISYNNKGNRVTLIKHRRNPRLL